MPIVDPNGVAVNPKDRAEQIVSAAERAIKTENRVRKAILEGVDPQKAYLQYGRF